VDSGSSNAVSCSLGLDSLSSGDFPPRGFVRGELSAVKLGTVCEKSRSRFGSVRDVREGVSSVAVLPGEDRGFGVLRGDEPRDVLIGDRARGGGRIGRSLLRSDLRPIRISVGSGRVPEQVDD
jgi:hypothetical protein